jgi:hypothetical protein
MGPEPSKSVLVVEELFSPFFSSHLAETVGKAGLLEPLARRKW